MFVLVAFWFLMSTVNLGMDHFAESGRGSSGDLDSVLPCIDVKHSFISTDARAEQVSNTPFSNQGRGVDAADRIFSVGACSEDTSQRVLHDSSNVFQQLRDVYNDDVQPFGDGEISDVALSLPLSGDVDGLDLEPGASSDLAASSWQEVFARDQPVVSAQIHDALFSHSLLTNFEATDIKLPRETGIYKELFSDEPFDVEGLIPKMQIGEMVQIRPESDPQGVAKTVADAITVVSNQPVYSGLVSCMDDEHFLDKRESLRKISLGKLSVVVHHCLAASQQGGIPLGTDLMFTRPREPLKFWVLLLESSLQLRLSNVLILFWLFSDGVQRQMSQMRTLFTNVSYGSICHS